MNRDVVYTLGDWSRDGDDFELRHSLRSLLGQEWLGRVWIVGHCPEWIDRDIVRHIPMPDHHNPERKDKNIILKLLRACAEEDLSREFVAFSDDKYLMRPIGLEELGPWNEKPSRYELIRDVAPTRLGLWNRRLWETVRHFQLQGRPVFTPEFHIPFAVDKALYPKVMLDMPWSVGNGLLSLAYVMAAHGADCVQDPPDGMIVRVKEPLDRDAVQRLAGGCVFLNHDDRGLNEHLMDFLAHTFPTPGPWEMYGGFNGSTVQRFSG
jgi:hypothetical protein